MNIEDLKKITDMAIKNAEKIVISSKETNDRSMLLQAYGALCFASSVIMDERIDVIINENNEGVEEINKMIEIINKKMRTLWESN